MRLSIILWVSANASAFPLSAAGNSPGGGDVSNGLSKVMILDFINTTGQEEFRYLEPSITDAVKDALRAQYAFEETPAAVIDQVASENFQFRDDFYVKSVAMNLGLLARQDVVVAGGFSIRQSPSNVKAAEILTRVTVLDIANKKVVSEFTVTGPADSRLFDSVNQISRRISVEMKGVLPNREEWQKKGVAAKIAREPLFGNISMGFRLGAFLYQGGLGPYFTPRQPAMFFFFTVRPSAHSSTPRRLG